MRISCVALALNTENELASDPVSPHPVFGLSSRWGLARLCVFICSLNSALTIKSLSSKRAALFVFYNTEGNMPYERPSPPFRVHLI